MSKQRIKMSAPAIRTRAQAAEVDRQRIIADAEILPPEELRACGLAVVQAEEFFVEPRLDEVDRRIEPAKEAA